MVRHLSDTTVKVLLPQGYFRRFDRNNQVIVRDFREENKILPMMDFVILSDEDHPRFLSIAKRWSVTYNLSAIATKGEKGAQIFTRGTSVLVKTQSIPKHEVVDSVGAGDVFSASFI